MSRQKRKNAKKNLLLTSLKTGIDFLKLINNNRFSIYFFLDKKVTKNQAGSKGKFILLGIFRTRTGHRNSPCCTGFNARFFIRAMAGYPIALIFRFAVSIKMWSSSNRKIGAMKILFARIY
ncbi:MAG: hypothetical protein IPG86_09715 [Chitinophagaceae bacterium]|nr:hypothetical protein [Chitinophagaceae bacterium]